MIRTAGPDRMGRHPWEPPRELAELGFAVVWATGPDPRRDGVFRLAALRRGADGAWERFDRFATPFADPVELGDPEAASATARMAREYGVTRSQLADAPSQEQAFAELLDFLGERPFVVPERAAFAGWAERLAPERRAGRVVGLSETAMLLVPGRLPLRAPDALDPESLQGELAELVARTLALAEPVLATLAHGFEEAWLRLHESERSAADELAFHLALCEHPSLWSAGASGLFAGGGKLRDGRLTAACGAFADLERAVDAARPRWGAAARDERKLEPLPTKPDEPVVLTESDRRLVDEILEEHLPRHFDGSYRQGQHAVAAEIARSFGEEGMLLVHAPTGTGKTLAYLVPTLLWAFRNGVRVGVATFTRALQEQALDRDVPLARELLRRAGVGDGLRVSLLKGRHNYLCWRALRLQAPTPMDPAEEWLAWTSLALFALTDEHGDLDRFPRRSPLELADPSAWRDSVVRLTMQSRSESGCCSLREDRENCASAAARRRAERAHVVITNHAFALQRREFFRYMVFDECEHLHGQAHSAFSHVVPFRHLRDTLLRLHEPGSGRRPLGRIREIALPDSEAAECARACIDSAEDALAAVDELQRAVFDFKTWREDVRGTRDERDLHSLFREFVAEHGSGPLLEAHRALTRALSELAAALAEMSEHLDTLPSRGILRIRRSLEVLRMELDELFAGVEAWIPRDGDGERPFFRPETFYDLETTPGGYDVMAARVLLPHEHLGRNYYPELAGAVLISATTWLRGGFESAAVYLGLERAARPAEEEERPPVPLRTFRAPEVFDYRRVLVAVPRDAPSLRTGKRAFLDYVARFVTHLGERTRGRMLVLFTNADDCVKTGLEVEGFFSERRIPFWYQRMEGAAKEELSELFRSRVDSVLFGLDTFWYGADFPGETLEYLVIVRLPYGVPDRYHHAQCAALGNGEQRRSIYMPRALAKLRQGFGRLMRKETDRGCVFVLDGRILEPRHRVFLQELPLRPPIERGSDSDGGASFVRGDTERCIREALAHMDMLTDVRRRDLDRSFEERVGEPPGGPPEARGTADRPVVADEDVPY